MQVIMHDEKLVVIEGERKREIAITQTQVNAMRALLAAGAMKQYQEGLAKLLEANPK